MIKGQLVTVHLFGGMTAQRRVVAQKGNIIVICSEEEYRSAERERREPCGVGFPQEDVEVLAPVPLIEMPATRKRVRVGV